MIDGTYLAADRMPEGLEHWQTVEVYCQSWASEMKPGRWQRWLVERLKPWHVWRYEAPSASDEIMLRSLAVRLRLGVTALEGNGFYTTREGGGA